MMVPKARPAPSDQRTQLPTLVPGRDRLPSRCGDCGSSLLTAEEPAGRQSRGMMTCGLCGRQLCWLGAGVRQQAAPLARLAPPSATRSQVASSPPPEDWRRPDCDDRCERMRVLPIGLSAVGRYRPEWFEKHDPDAHASYQSALTIALAVLCASPPAPHDLVVGTGLLAFDLETRRCMVDGATVTLTPTEAALLGFFARRLGRFCTVAEATADVWPWFDPTNDRRFRVTLARLLPKLGLARRLLLRQHGYGYMLAEEPYTGPVDFPPLTRPESPIPPWSMAHARCIDCGTTARPHQGHGLCATCRYRRLPRELRHTGRKRKDATP